MAKDGGRRRREEEEGRGKGKRMANPRGRLAKKEDEKECLDSMALNEGRKMAIKGAERREGGKKEEYGQRKGIKVMKSEGRRRRRSRG
jgi:hypothetical protein